MTDKTVTIYVKDGYFFTTIINSETRQEMAIDVSGRIAQITLVKEETHCFMVASVENASIPMAKVETKFWDGLVKMRDVMIAKTGSSPSIEITNVEDWVE